LVEFFILSGPITLMLNLLTLTVGFFLARVFLLSKRQSITIAIESGIQNGTLGIMIAATLLKNSEMTIPVAIYSLIMFMTSAVIIVLTNRKPS
jgi:BASS family bile acid:Na+ symporter